MIQFVVDENKCTRCGQCVRDCVAKIIRQTGANVPHILPEAEANCIRCQHCLAVCPSAAVSIFGRAPSASVPLKADSFPSLGNMLNLVRGRRSVRQYRDENVNPDVLRQLLETLGNVPTGVNRMALTFSVIDDIDAMRRFRDKAYRLIADAVKAGSLPDPTMSFLQGAADAWRERGEDTIFRGAPHLLLVSAGPDSACPQEDVALALAYFELTAQCAGLGTVWCGLMKWAMESVPALKTSVGIPPDHSYYAMLFGLPSVHYPRAVQRDGTGQIRRIQA
jgi:nitroreductase/NAD-dependent dihydropyrimidine dehydrogenase PreA subunit